MDVEERVRTLQYTIDHELFQLARNFHECVDFLATSGETFFIVLQHVSTCQFNFYEIEK